MSLYTVLWDEASNELAREAVGPTAPAFDLITHLGDGALLVVLGVLIYWFGAPDNRRDRAFVIAVGIAALALSAGLKGIFQIPRPELAFSPEAYPGYTFPSAHAMGAAAFYGALAVTMEWGRRRVRYVLAGTLIALIALSRVVMGVHYIGDVLVGVALGLALVAVGIWLAREGVFDPGPTFVLAAGIAVGALLLGSRQFVSLTLGASLGGTIGWYYVRDRSTTDTGAAVLTAGVLALIGILFLRLLPELLGLSAPNVAFNPLVVGLEIVGYSLLTAMTIALPAFAIRIEDRPTVQRLQRALPFRGRRFEAEDTPLGDD